MVRFRASVGRFYIFYILFYWLQEQLNLQPSKYLSKKKQDIKRILTPLSDKPYVKDPYHRYQLRVFCEAALGRYCACHGRCEQIKAGRCSRSL
jgi:hypothetical protein